MDCYDTNKSLGSSIIELVFWIVTLDYIGINMLSYPSFSFAVFPLRPSSFHLFISIKDIDLLSQ